MPCMLSGSRPSWGCIYQLDRRYGKGFWPGVSWGFTCLTVLVKPHYLWFPNTHRMACSSALQSSTKRLGYLLVALWRLCATFIECFPINFLLNDAFFPPSSIQHTSTQHRGWLIPCGDMLTLFNSSAAHVEHSLDVLSLHPSPSNCIPSSLSTLVAFSILSRTRGAV